MAQPEVHMARTWPEWPEFGRKGKPVAAMARLARKRRDWRESGAIQLRGQIAPVGSE